MPRLVRRAPLSERIKAYLDPQDWLMWILEELNDDAIDDWLQLWTTPLGLGANVAFIIARGASQRPTSSGVDEVFGDDVQKGSGWLSWLSAVCVTTLSLICCANALYTFLRVRKYRLFEQPIDVPPATPSAKRVPVDGGSVLKSPSHYVNEALERIKIAMGYAGASAGEHEVWELHVWNPRTTSLSLFVLFSPGHLLLYYTLLPSSSTDIRPSVAILRALAFGALLSAQLSLLQISFNRQAKDHSIIHGQVMNEYDTKFVRPILHHPVRDVGTQTLDSRSSLIGRAGHEKVFEVDLYTPTTSVHRGFHVHPNPRFVDDYDPKHLGTEGDDESAWIRRKSDLPSAFSTPSLIAAAKTRKSTGSDAVSSGVNAGTQVARSSDFSSPIKAHRERFRERQSAFAIDSPGRRASTTAAVNGKYDSPEINSDRRPGRSRF